MNPRTAPSALDVICSTETMAEIIDAMTPQQLTVAGLLWLGMTLREIADELSEDGPRITWQAIQCRKDQAQQRVASTLYHCNAEHLHGDVLSRRRWGYRKEREGMA